LLLSFVIAAGLVQLLFYKSLLWDETVYVAIGKDIFSGGKSGFFEVLRPLGLPLVIGAIWQTGLFPLILSKMAMLAFSLLFVYLTYLIGMKSFDRRVGLIAAALVAVSPVFLFSSTRIMTDIPSSVFAMAAAYNFLSNRQKTAGFFSALAFLFRFPSGIILASIGLSAFWSYRKNIGRLLKVATDLCIGFAIPISGYLIINSLKFSAYGFPASAFRPLVEALWSQGNQAEAVIGVSLLSKVYNLFFYLVEPAKENLAYLFALAGIVHFFRIRRNRRTSVLLSVIILSVAYLTLIANKQARFMLIFLWALAIISALGIEALLNSRKSVSYMLILVGSAIAVVPGAALASGFSYGESVEFIDSLVQVFEDNNITEPIVSTIPYVAPFIDNKIHPNFFSSEVVSLQFELDKDIRHMIF